MKYGAHNVLTAYSLIGWKKYFRRIIDPFCKCQNNLIYEHFIFGIRLFDIQMAKKNGLWLGSHGIAWYNVFPLDILNILNNWTNDEKIYIILGLDNHPFAEDSREEFLNIIKNFSINYPNLTLVRAYIDKNYEIIYEDKEFFKDVYEKYWSTSWAKSMNRLWYYLPLPKYWRNKFHLKWFNEAQSLNKKYLITDFV